MTLAIAFLLVFCAGLIVGVVLVRYGIRVGNRLTIAAMNSEPLDEKKVSAILESQTS